MVSLTQAGLSFAAGGLTTLSPCVFPILPLVVGSATARHALAPVAMAVGMILSFAIMGILVGLFGDSLGFDADFLRPVGGVLLLLFGLVMLIPVLDVRFSALLAPLASGAARLSANGSSADLGGSLLIGATLGLVWSPCSGPLLASTLALAASEGGALAGGGLLAIFGAGAALPLLSVAYASRQTLAKLRPSVLAQTARLKQGFGILLILAGLAVLTGLDKRLEAALLDVLPESWTALTGML
jgi:cytochrome c-type biogenesis protein